MTEEAIRPLDQYPKGGCLKLSLQGVETALQSRLFTAPFYDQ